MRKFIDFICEVMCYSAKHWSAILITDMMLSIGLLNPFVVEKFQSIYRYPVTKNGAMVMDIVYIIIIIIAWNVDKWINKLETEK